MMVKISKSNTFGKSVNALSDLVSTEFAKVLNSNFSLRRWDSWS